MKIQVRKVVPTKNIISNILDKKLYAPNGLAFPVFYTFLHCNVEINRLSTAYVNGVLIGWAVIIPCDKENAHLWVYVLPKFRGLGIASKLINNIRKNSQFNFIVCKKGKRKDFWNKQKL